MQEGDKVVLQGLEGAPELNGSSATISGFKGDRVVVIIDGSGKVHFRFHKLRNT